MRFRFVHAADLHLDAPFRGLARLDATIAERLRDASLLALNRIVEKAIEAEAAFVVFAGDLYDGVDHGIRAQIRFREALGRLSEQGIRAFIVHGNHDPEGGRWNATRSWPEGVTVFRSRTPQQHTVEVEGVQIATVHGVSFGTRKEKNNLALRFPDTPGPGVNVAVLHGNVAGQPGHDPYAPCALEDLTRKPMDYWALGHVHRHLVLHRQPWVVYPGNTQGRGFKANERGPKGALLVEVEDGRVLEPEFFPTASVSFGEVPIDLATVDDLPSIVARLNGEARETLETMSDPALLLRARLSGRTPLYGELRSAEAREQVLSELSANAPSGAHWLALDFAARPLLDLEGIRASDDLRASLLQASQEWGRGEAELPSALLERVRSAFRGEKQDEELEHLVRKFAESAAHDLVERMTPIEEDRA